MKKLVIILFFIFIALPLNTVFAQEKVNLYFFYGDGCPHCAKEEKLLNQLETENSDIAIYRYEVWHNRDNAQLLAKVGKELGLDVSGVPLLIVGDQTIVGYFSAETTGKKIKNLIADYSKNGCDDLVAPILRDVSGSEQCIHGCDLGDQACLHDCGCDADLAEEEIQDIITIPLIGEINIKNFSLPILTLVLAGADGFNPCAMWVLLFLISLLLGMKDRRRMWILGSSFIIASGAVYFLFLAAWLNLFLFLGFVLWVRIVIGLVALGSGGLHIRSWWKNREGCEIIEEEKRKKMFDKIRNIIAEKKFWLAVSGVVILAGAVNLVELVCSAGLPAVYTQVLALANLPTWQYYGYLFLYIFIFMFDDMLIFFIAMTTLRMKAIEAKFTKYSSLIGGVIMLIVGLLLLFKPGWLMFG